MQQHVKKTEEETSAIGNRIEEIVQATVVEKRAPTDEEFAEYKRLVLELVSDTIDGVMEGEDGERGPLYGFVFFVGNECLGDGSHHTFCTEIANGHLQRAAFRKIVAEADPMVRLMSILGS